MNKEKQKGCPHAKKCGGCQYQGIAYEKQCQLKQRQAKELLGKFAKVEPIITMEHPYHYRNKVHAVFDHDRKGNPISGVYQLGTHKVVPIEKCLIEDKLADEIIGTIRGMLKSFKIKTYDEDTEYGLLRHVLIKRGFHSNEVMVVLVTASPIFPSKNNFVKALRKVHPEITTIIQNVNEQKTNMILGNRENILYGRGYIEDTLCGMVFRISSKSFYQVNPIQTEKLYAKAMELAELSGKERVIDAYCGIGTIALVAATKAEEVIGIELNKDAVSNAVFNAKRNQITNTFFSQGDAGACMVKMAEEGKRADVVFMDPPRSGSTEQFMDAVAVMGPKRLVYISCNPETLARDLLYLKKKNYQVKSIHPVDMFPWTDELEIVVLLSRISIK